MHVKQWFVVGVTLVAGGAALWRALARRRALTQPALETERIRNAGRLVAGGGVRRIT
jgi:hypothetical protein